MDGFLELLKRHQIGYLIDVRSFPRSRYNPDFSGDVLQISLSEVGIRYVFMGDLLGGNPSNPEVRTDEGLKAPGSYLIDYRKQMTTAEFRKGLDRLRRAYHIGARIILLCSETKPEDCHRVRLIGEALHEEGINVSHIDENDEVLTQAKIMLRLTNGQPLLPGLDPPLRLYMSSRTWKVQDSEYDEPGSDV